MRTEELRQTDGIGRAERIAGSHVHGTVVAAALHCIFLGGVRRKGRNVYYFGEYI